MKKRNSKFIGEIEFKPKGGKTVKKPTKVERLAAQLAKKKKQQLVRKKPVQKAKKRIGRTY